MTTRAMGPLAGIGWLKNAVNLGRRNPKAVFGGAALLLLAVMAVLIPVVLLQMFLLVKFSLTGAPAIAVSLLASLVMLLIFPGLMVGYMRLLHSVELQLPVGATDAFGAFRDIPVSLRALGFMLLLLVLHYALLLMLLGVLAPDFIGWYFDAMQMSAAGGAKQQAALPAGFWTGFALLMASSLLAYAAQSLGFGQIALHDRRVPGALADGIVGTLRNVLPVLLLLVFAVIAWVVVVGLLVLVAMLLVFLAKLAGTWLVIALIVLAVPATLGLMLALYVVMFGVMYYMWRDVCGGGRQSEMPTEALVA